MHLCAAAATVATGAVAVSVDVPLISKAHGPAGKFDPERSSHFAASPPYLATIFAEPDIITTDDPTTYKSHAYRGTGTRTVFDRRIGTWITITMRLYDVSYGTTTIEFAAHNEFSAHEAEMEIEAYALEVGRMPAMLQDGVRQVWIMKGDMPWGGGPGNGGDILRHVLIHTGKGQTYRGQGVVVETLIHEAVHAVLDAAIYADPAWRAAAEGDGEYISTYAWDEPWREDAAETLLLWLAVRHRTDRLSSADHEIIVNTVPLRIDYFDRQGYNVAPLGIITPPTRSPTKAPTKAIPPPTRSPTEAPTKAIPPPTRSPTKAIPATMSPTPASPATMRPTITSPPSPTNGAKNGGKTPKTGGKTPKTGKTNGRKIGVLTANAANPFS